jgi:general secretion pathway protein G
MSRGFVYTLLVVVAGGIVLLWLAFGPGSQGGDDSRSGIARVRSDYDTLNAMILTYAINAGRPPTTEQGLEALVTRPTMEPLPEDWVQIAFKVPTDPWRQPYHYRELPAKGGEYRWEIRSMGPDGRLWTEDDRYPDGRPMRR